MNNINIELIKTDRLYESLRFAEYDITSGIGEIIDNSIEAKARKIFIDIEIEKIDGVKSKKKKIDIIKSITITDDGIGMDRNVLSKCLVLGESCRSLVNGKKGIGRFGVGLTLGGISLARRIEVYSKKDIEGEFNYSYIDLDEIVNKELQYVPMPIEKKPEKIYSEYINNCTGTIIKLKNCDRLRIDAVKGGSIDASENIKGLTTFIGRTYRKFISAGLNIYMNGEKIFLHDPLYLDGPTKFDSKECVDLKAEFIGEDTISLDVPNSKGKKADVKIRMSLLPKEWRKEKGDGGKDFAMKRKINENEGISILRADREVLYGKVEYIIGMRGTAKYEDKDRFWGCEISFPPELDDYFHIRYIKRGAEPIPSLRDQIRIKIAPVVKSLRAEITKEWSKNSAEEQKKSGVFKSAENTMEVIDNKLPRSIKGLSLSNEEAKQKIQETVNQIVIPLDEDINAFKKNKIEEINNKPYSIELVNYPSNIFFEKEHILGKIIIKLNINHPFYNKIILPLCEIDDDSLEDERIIEKRKFKDAIMLILLSYSKAEAMFDGNDELFNNFSFQWGTILATAIKEVFN
ncbi:ATP-binding protein [Clostridium butyricum]